MVEPRRRRELLIQSAYDLVRVNPGIDRIKLVGLVLDTLVTLLEEEGVESPVSREQGEQGEQGEQSFS